MSVQRAETVDITTRQPSDVLRLVVAVVVILVLLLVEWLFGNTLVTFASDLLRGFRAIPEWIVDVLAVGGRILGIAFLVFGLLLTLYRNGWRMLGTVVAAGVIGAALTLVLDGLVDTVDGDLVTKLST